MLRTGLKMHGLKRAATLTRSLKDGWYATIYYNVETGDIDVFHHHIDEGPMPDGNWEDVRMILVDHTFTKMTMKQIADCVEDAVARRCKD